MPEPSDTRFSLLVFLSVGPSVRLSVCFCLSLFVWEFLFVYTFLYVCLFVHF